MATVTAFTAERMLEIEQTTVVGGAIVDGELILLRRDGELVNAGNVGGVEGEPGPPGPTSIEVVTSTSRPSGPSEGLFIYETDTDRFFSWNGSTWVERGQGVIFCTSSTRPTVTYEGMAIFETDTNLYYTYVDGAWHKNGWGSEAPNDGVSYLRKNTAWASTKRVAGGPSQTSTDAGGNIIIAHGLGAAPTSFGLTLMSSNSGSVIQVAKLFVGGVDATNFTVSVMRSDTGVLLVSTAVHFYWQALL